MLEEARSTPTQLAWLRDSERKRALRVQSRQPAPQAGVLSFFAPDFALNDATPWLCGQEIAWPELSPQNLPPLVHRAEPSSAGFARLHEDVMHRISLGEFAKVVPIVCEELEYESALNAAMFPKAFTPPEGQFGYGFDFGGEGLCGVTPELLFEVEGGRLRTMALAGTGPAGGPSLLEDPKERREHELVIEHIASELKTWGRPEVGETVERAYGVLKHLYTPIEMRFDQTPTFMELIVRLHPTAALGGWPRKPAIEWLERQEFHTTRRRFGAPFGYTDGSYSKCVVAIRGLQWKGQCALLSSGCGVVQGSETLREWKELGLKRQATRLNMGLEL